MSPEKLHSIVIGFTRKEKIQFSNWISNNSSMKGKKPKHVVLYERLKRQKKYDDSIIRGKEFKSGKEYNKYREILTTKIFECFSQSPEQGENSVSLIKTALHFGAISWAQIHFSNEIENCISEQNFTQLSYLLLLRDEIFEDFRIELYSLPDRYSLSDAVEKSQFIQTLIDLNRAARATAKSNSEEKRALSERISEYVSGVNGTTPYESYLVQRLRRDQEVLLGNYRKAHLIQLGISESISDKIEEFRIPTRILEFANGALSGLRLGFHQQVFHFLTSLSNIEPRNLLEKNELERWQILRTIEAGVELCNYSFLVEGQKNLLAKTDLFPSPKTVKYLYYCALGFLFLEKYSEGQHCLRKIRETPRSMWGELSWQPSVLWAVYQYENDDVAMFDSAVLSAKRSLRSVGLHYPNLILSALTEFKNCFSDQGYESIYLAYKARLIELSSDLDEKRQFNYFDFKDWMLSKKLRCSIAELKAQQIEPPNNSIASGI